MVRNVDHNFPKAHTVLKQSKPPHAKLTVIKDQEIYFISHLKSIIFVIYFYFKKLHIMAFQNSALHSYAI